MNQHAGKLMFEHVYYTPGRRELQVLFSNLYSKKLKDLKGDFNNDE